MRDAMKQIVNYFRLSLIFDLKATMAYPTTFWFAFWAIPLWSLIQILFIETIYAQTDSFLGYSKYENYLLFGTFKLVQSVAVILFFVRLEDLTDKIRGTSDWSLDTMLLKPIDSQLYATTGKFWFGSISSVATGIGLMAYGLVREPHLLTVWNWLAFAYTAGLGVILFYLLYLFIQTWLFWFEYLQIGEDMWFAMQEFGQFPRRLYSGWSGVVMNLAIPLTLSAAVPVDYLLGRIEPWRLLLYTAIIGFLFTLCRRFWQYSIRKYSSYSS